jgi:quercetin dioxygenase-like cupin family protein
MVAFIIIGILLIPVVYNQLFPFKRPDMENYFSPGYVFDSKGEGIIQRVIRQEGRKIYMESRFAPGAAGPPEHLHKNTDESATVIKGTLTTKINGKISRLEPGDRLVFKKGIYHRMYNETNEEVILRSEKEEDFIPVEFAYSLAQLYHLVPGNGKLSVELLAKICVLDEYFDMVPKGPAPALYKLIKKIVKPYARLFGVTPYDSKSRPA